MFELKKLISLLVYPLGIFFLLQLTLAIGAVMTRRARLVLLLSLLGLYSLSTPYLSNQLALGLEAPFLRTASLPQVEFIVVLSGGIQAEPGRISSDQMNEATLKRTLSGINAAQQLPRARLILSGGSSGGMRAKAEIMAEFAIAQGVEASRITVERISLDTADQAIFLAPMLGQKPFVLVTSAYHMSRSLNLFRMAGTSPIPIATDYLHSDNQALNALSLLPSAHALADSTSIIHEYLGLAWMHWQGVTPRG